MKNGWIIGEMDKSYDKFKQKWHNKLPLDCWYPGVLGRYTKFKVLHPHTSNQSSVLSKSVCDGSSVLSKLVCDG